MVNFILLYFTIIKINTKNVVIIIVSQSGILKVVLLLSVISVGSHSTLFLCAWFLVIFYSTLVVVSEKILVDIL